MSIISLGSGAPLRLRIHAGLRFAQKEPEHDPRPLKPKRVPTTVPLFPEAGSVSTAELKSERMARQVVQLALMNRVNATILERFPSLGLKDWWLTSGCIFQSVWNLRLGRPAGQGIDDYDIVYFSEDASWEAEDQVIQDTARLFDDLDADVQVRNQARAPLWYQEKFGVEFPPVTCASESIMRFPSRASAVGLKRTGDEFLDLFAPFGLDDIWNFVVTPNRTLQAARTFNEKVVRWKKEWPQLTVHPWADDASR
jgi:uncharacterized protein